MGEQNLVSESQSKEQLELETKVGGEGRQKEEDLVREEVVVPDVPRRESKPLKHVQRKIRCPFCACLFTDDGEIIHAPKAKAEKKVKPRKGFFFEEEDD